MKVSFSYGAHGKVYNHRFLWKMMKRKKTDDYLNSKEHKDWRRKIIERDKGCVICGEVKHVSAHHILPKEISQYRTNIDNGITLCFKHHTRYGWKLSPHSHGSFLFFAWLMKNRPEQFQKVTEMWSSEIYL